MDRNTEVKIDKILDKYRIKAPERTVCKEVAGVINDLLGVELSTDDIQYQKGTVWVDSSPLLRSQIHIQKQEIKKRLSERLENRQIADMH